MRLRREATDEQRRAIERLRAEVSGTFFRMRGGMSLSQLAERAGISAYGVWRVEARQPVRLEVLARLAVACGKRLRLVVEDVPGYVERESMSFSS